MVVGVIEFAVLGYGVHRYRKHKQHKRESEAASARTGAPSVYAHVQDLTPPPSYQSATRLASSNCATPAASKPSSFVPDSERKTSPPAPVCDDGIPKTLNSTNDKLQKFGREWRPVYMLERSTSRSGYNQIRTHRALFVGEFVEGQGTGRAHEIRKQKSSSFFGVAPWGRTMRYTDAEEWTGIKALDREPVFLGHTDWTDEELNHEGHRMVDDYPAYSLSYANCQHFVADLADKIIPDERQSPDMARTRPTFDRLLEELGSGEYEGHGDAVLNGVADLTLGAAKQTHKFFHFTKAMVMSLTSLDWRPFDDYNRLIKNQNLRVIAAHERESRRRGPRYVAGNSTGSSSASESSANVSTTGGPN